MKILIPTDFSENSRKAALYAAEISQSTGAQLFVYHALEKTHEKFTQPFSLHAKFDALVMEDRKTEIESFCGSLLSVYSGLRVENVIDESDASATESILNFSQKNNIDLVIMGTKGAGILKERLVGTVAAAVVSRSKIPVLLIPSEYELEQPDKILFVTNHYEKDRKTLSLIAEFAKIFSARVHVVSFLDSDSADGADFVETGRRIEFFRKFLEESFPEVKFSGEVIEGKHFESAIELYHAVNDTDLTVMIRYHKGFWEKVMHLGATRKMAYHTHLPLLIIPSSN